ncbi:TIR domain-containing protein [Treponema sp. Marseille-Q4130]|uniref:TIR domain-containing protein n=1 Tax=Treponema sp. Marseille-Q4130 TaxID=2766702 RepID=UPI001651EB16|nr:TIR domain-containing protein [Treponema sp. Marseille-Q4130]MBC6720513.1 TIR domain-containing protein [Treponema sp. Marseille-Q4130]
MANKKNIFVAHCGEHEELISDFKSMMEKEGFSFKDSSLTSERPNNAHDENYIKYSIIKPKMEWAGTVVVLIGKETSKSDWVNWEIEEAIKLGKQVIGVHVSKDYNYEIPEGLKDFADSIVPWNGNDIKKALDGNIIYKDAHGTSIALGTAMNHGEC